MIIGLIVFISDSFSVKGEINIVNVGQSYKAYVGVIWQNMLILYGFQIRFIGLPTKLFILKQFCQIFKDWSKSG